MKKIQVKILNHNLSPMPKFLARLTQRGHLINGMDDLMKIYDESMDKAPSKYFMTTPHSTLRRMNYLTIAITGLSTKCVSQLRTHAKRLTFVSTSTQYSSFEGRDDNYVIPFGLDESHEAAYVNALYELQQVYNDLIEAGADKDKVGYLLPQGLRKAVVISGNLDDWQYVLRLRLCKRNTAETRYVMRLIYDAITNECGDEYVVGMLPTCVEGKCQEGKFSCGEKFDENSFY